MSYLSKYQLGLILVLLSLHSCTDRISGNFDPHIDRALLSQIQAAAPNGSLDFYKLPTDSDYTAIPQDEKNPITASKVILGKMLFHEPALLTKPKLESNKHKSSCASCHMVEHGFGAGINQALGEGGEGFGKSRTSIPTMSAHMIDAQMIKSPSCLNVAYQSNMTWNGKFGAQGLNSKTRSLWDKEAVLRFNKEGLEGVETQALAALEVHRMAIDAKWVLKYGYTQLFDEAFADLSISERYSNKSVALALAAYQRTLLPDQAPFQKWLNGEKSALSDVEKKGAALFFGYAQCAQCHTGPGLNGMDFCALGFKDIEQAHTGIILNDSTDTQFQGRASFTKDNKDLYKFKVPQLYNLADNPIYGHGGSFQDLRSLVMYKCKGIPENEKVDKGQLDPRFKDLHLTSTEIESISLFLEHGLYDPNLKRYVPEVLPSGNCFPNGDAQSITHKCN